MVETTSYRKVRKDAAPKPSDSGRWAVISPVNPVHELRSGDACPKCGKANLDYDGLLNLSCPACGYAVGGCFT